MTDKNPRYKKERPPPVVIRRKNLGPMQDLLLRTCWPNKDNEVSINYLARIMCLSEQTIYAWIRKGWIPAHHIDHLIKLNHSWANDHQILKASVNWDRVVARSDYAPYQKGAQ